MVLGGDTQWGAVWGQSCWSHDDREGCTWDSYLQAILAEFLFPVNSASLEALNSISLLTSSSVTVEPEGQNVRGQKPSKVERFPSKTFLLHTRLLTFVVVLLTLRDRV